MPPALERKGVGGYFFRVGFVADVLLNVLLGGEPETVSSRLGKCKLRQGGVLTWGNWGGLAKPLDWVLEKIERGHALGSIDPDRGELPRPPSTSTRP